jgi:hypothetical protein
LYSIAFYGIIFSFYIMLLETIFSGSQEAFLDVITRNDGAAMPPALVAESPGMV